MTLQLRPTFSESWYRVKNLRARLRAGAQISRQFYRGERWYVVRDPAGNQYHRLSDPAYRFVGLLDGTRTVEEAWDLAGGMLEDDAPTQPEVIQILTHLYSANLIDADVTPDATVLLRRHKQLSQRKMQNRLMNVLFPRIPLWDPDRFLQRWMPLARVGLSWFGVIVWLLVVGTGVGVVIAMWNAPGHSIQEAAKSAVDIKSSPEKLLLLWGTFVFIKLIHELGHAFSCRRFGGECHELGIMFLVFIPTPYVDASSAWQFSNKWQRIFVGAGGMIVELFFAALCTFVWANVNPDGVLSKLAFNSMLVAGVTTIVFNANPLLRYDGYYILSDFLEIPNLRQKSTEYAMGLIKRHVFRVKAQQPLPPVLQRFWLFFYAVLSTIYRTFVGIVIILMVGYQIPVLGLLMALGGVITWAIVPVFKLFKYLTIDPELHRKRGRATVFSLAVITAVVVLVGFIKFPVSLEAMGYLQPAQRSVVHAGRPGGFVTKVLVADRQWVKGNVYRRDENGHIVFEQRGFKRRPVIEQPGTVLVECVSKELNAEIEQTQANLDEKLAEQQSAVAQSQDAQIYDTLIKNLRQELDEYNAQREELTLRAEIDGQLMAPEMDQLQGQFLPPGKEVGVISQNDNVIVRTLLEQKDAEPIMNGKNIKIAIRPAGDIWSKIQLAPGATPHWMPAAVDEQQPTLTQAAGTEVAADPKHPEKSAIPQFNVDVSVDNFDRFHYKAQSESGQPATGFIVAASPADAASFLSAQHMRDVKLERVEASSGPELRADKVSKFMIGQRAYVWFTLDSQPLIVQWTRRFYQLIQQKNSASKWI